MAILHKKTKENKLCSASRLKYERALKRKTGVQMSSQCLVDYIHQYNLTADNFFILTGFGQTTMDILFKSDRDVLYHSTCVVEKVIRSLYLGMPVEHRIDLKKLMPRLWLDCKIQRWGKEIKSLLSTIILEEK